MDYLQISELYHHGIKGQKWGVRNEKKESNVSGKRKVAGTALGAVAGYGTAATGLLLGESILGGIMQAKLAGSKSKFEFNKALQKGHKAMDTMTKLIGPITIATLTTAGGLTGYSIAKKTGNKQNKNNSAKHSHTEDDDELYHYGIKGQKKGNRRFQYEDGSLTPEGKERYRKERETNTRASDVTSGTLQTIGKTRNDISKPFKTNTAGKIGNELGKTSKELMNISKNIKTKPGMYVKKDYSNLSDQELQRRINRLNLENTYGKLTGDTKYIKSGSEKTRELLQTIGSVVAIGSSSAIIAQIIYNMATGHK